MPHSSTANSGNACLSLGVIPLRALVRLLHVCGLAGSAIYIASVNLVAYEYTTSIQVALLGLSLYGLGYGFGPRLRAPLSGIYVIGRNPIYTMTKLVFLVISIGCAKATLLPGFLVLPFVHGFFGSPCLINVGVSLHDIFERRYLPLAQTIWVADAYALLYSIYIFRWAHKTSGLAPEDRLRPALPAVFAAPIGIFLFGWTAEPTHHVHWVLGMLGLVIYAGGAFVILQCTMMYILDSYPRYAASLFAANDFSRSALAAGAVHFGLPLCTHLGPGKACSVLGSVSVLGIGGMFVLYWQRAKLRARSKFTAYVSKEALAIHRPTLL